MSDDPICSLPPEALEERLQWIRREILPHAVGEARDAERLAFELTDAPGLREKLDLLVALERDCCPSLVFAREPSATSGQCRLEVRGTEARLDVAHAALRREKRDDP